MDELGLVEAIDRLGESVVVGIADAANRRLDACPRQALGILDRDVLSEFKWSSQRLERAAMKRGKRQSDRSGRAAVRLPGRPTVANREQIRRFWAAISAGLVSEEAAATAGVPQAVGALWFRKAGGMRPAMFGPSAQPRSGRYLSLPEREEIALLRAQGCTIREMGRRIQRAASTVSRELRRNAAT